MQRPPRIALGPLPKRRRADGRDAGWPLVLALAALWAVLPALPALLAGKLIGSPWTDLYPSAWGLAWFADHQPGLPTLATSLGAPDGQPFYYSSPIHGWVGTPLVAFFGPVVAWNVTVVLARFATVATAYGAARAWGLGLPGGLLAALAWGASPFFHGYAAEGIVEGLDGWALAWMLWALAGAPMTGRAAHDGKASLRRVVRGFHGGLALAVTIVSSWYLGIVGCALVFAMAVGSLVVGRSGLGLRAGLALVTGVVLALPFALTFHDTMAGAAPLPDTVRAAMGTVLSVRTPGWLAPHPFAMTTWVGLSLPLLALPSAWKHPRVALVTLAFAVLSLGRGPWYDLPVLEAVRFPYRWHAGTLLGLAWLAGRTVDDLRIRAVTDGGAWRFVGALALVPWIEGYVGSPIPPVLPSADAAIPAIYEGVRGPLLLEIPGPVAMAPGTVNRSRPRARYLLWAQTLHGAASPWKPDWNGLAAPAPTDAWLDPWRSWDPLLHKTPVAPDLRVARDRGVTQVMLHRDELGDARSRTLLEALTASGATVRADDGTQVLVDLPR